MNRIVLRHLEAQKLFRLAMVANYPLIFSRLFFFHQVERTGIGPRDFPALGQNQFQQLARVVFGAQRRADVVQFVNLGVRQSQLIVGLPPRLHQVHVIDCIVEHALQQRRRSVCRKVGIDRAVESWIAKALRRKAQ